MGCRAALRRFAARSRRSPQGLQPARHHLRAARLPIAGRQGSPAAHAGRRSRRAQRRDHPGERPQGDEKRRRLCTLRNDLPRRKPGPLPHAHSSLPAQRGVCAEGRGARNAIGGGLRESQGHPGGEAALEGDAGFYHAYRGKNKGGLTYTFPGARHADPAKITANLGKDWILLETLYRVYSIAGYNIAHIDVTAKLCEKHNIRYANVHRVEPVVNWLQTQNPIPPLPTPREA